MYLSDKFICATKEKNGMRKHVNAPYFRKTFVPNQEAESYTITICGLGFYELYLNGKNITKGKLAPYISNSDQIMFYDCYQLKDLLVEGENVIGVLLGNGMQNAVGGDVWDFHKAPFISAPKFAMAYEEDDNVVFEADDGFICHPSPIVFDDLRAGVIYDANQEISGWADLSLESTKDWYPAMPAVTPKGEKTLSGRNVVDFVKDVSPISVKKNKKGYVYDFGGNYSGICTLKIKGKKGQKIYMSHVEALTENGEAYTRNLTCGRPNYVKAHLWQTETYICKGDEEEIFTPSFTYNGFRFVLVEGISERQATDELLTLHEMHSVFEERGSFVCSDDTINKLYQIYKNSVLANYVFFPTDCPHREKNGWTGDAAVSTEPTLYTFKADKSYKDWLKCIVRAQREDGALPGIVPTGGWGFRWGNGPSWDTILFTLAFNLYKFTGDKEILTDSLPAMEKYLKYVLSKRSSDGTIAIGLGDWLEVDRPNGNPRTPIAVTDTLQCMNIARLTSLMFKEVGDVEGANFARETYDVFKKAFINKFVDTDRKIVSVATQTAQSMAITYGVFAPEEISEAGKNLREIIKSDGDVMRVGILGTANLFQALSICGYDDLAFKMLTDGHYSSPSFFVNKGYNSLWEAFKNVSSGENGVYSKKDACQIFSLNHHFMGAGYTSWLYKYVLGIDYNPNGNDKNVVRITPHYPSQLTYAEGTVKFATGSVSVKWIKKGDTIFLTKKITGSIKEIK